VLHISEEETVSPGWYWNTKHGGCNKICPMRGYRAKMQKRLEDAFILLMRG